MFERVEFVATADMSLADEDLWHSHSPGGAFDHLGASRRIATNVDLAEGDVLAGQQRFRHATVAAILRRVDFNRGGHGGIPAALPSAPNRFDYMGFRLPSTTRA